MKDIVDRINKEELEYSEEIRAMYHKNCAEILLQAAGEKYDLNLDQRFLKAVCPYGGGLQSESTCGALLGGLAAIGVMYAEDKPSTNDKMKQKTQKYVEEFQKEFGSIDCKNIKEHHRSETEGCNPVKIRSAAVLEKVIDEE